MYKEKTAFSVKNMMDKAVFQVEILAYLDFLCVF